MNVHVHSISNHAEYWDSLFKYHYNIPTNKPELSKQKDINIFAKYCHMLFSTNMTFIFGGLAIRKDLRLELFFLNECSARNCLAVSDLLLCMIQYSYGTDKTDSTDRARARTAGPMRKVKFVRHGRWFTRTRSLQNYLYFRPWQY